MRMLFTENSELKTAVNFLATAMDGLMDESTLRLDHTAEGFTFTLTLADGSEQSGVLVDAESGYALTEFPPVFEWELQEKHNYQHGC